MLSLTEREKLVRIPLTNLRYQLDKAVIKGVKGVSIVERVDERPLRETCILYVFPKGSILTIEEIIQSHKPCTQKQANIAIYLQNQDFRHIGRVAENETVYSKWDIFGHVYRHKPELVPTRYGNIVVYYNMSAGQ